MHIIPFELNSVVIYELLKAVQTRGNDLWNLMVSQIVLLSSSSLRTNQDTKLSNDFVKNTTPLIGNVALMRNAKLTDNGPRGAINAVRNLFVASADLHYVNDKTNGLLLSTTVRPVALSIFYLFILCSSHLSGYTKSRLPTP